MREIVEERSEFRQDGTNGFLKQNDMSQRSQGDKDAFSRLDTSCTENSADSLRTPCCLTSWAFKLSTNAMYCSLAGIMSARGAYSQCHEHVCDTVADSGICVLTRFIVNCVLFSSERRRLSSRPSFAFCPSRRRLRCVSKYQYK